MAATLRKFPYPYLGAMSICADCDSMQLSRWRGDNFEDTHIFVNTKEQSLWGTGVGLDMGDSFFMYNQAKHLADIGHASFSMNGWTNIQNARAMSYWDGLSTTPRDKDAILRYIRCGWIDCIHAYGDFSPLNDADYLCTREMSIAACQELINQGVALDVWINHGAASNKQNIVINSGDDPAETTYYHTDVTIPYGIRFFWNGAVTEGLDTLLVAATLRDGQKLWSFPRYYENASDGVTNWQMKYFHEQITEARLNEIKTGKYMIVAQHFGAYKYVWPQTAIDAWKLLAAEWEANNILVTRTSRLLRYNLANDCVQWTYDAEADAVIITTIADPQLGSFVPTLNDIRGLTWEGTTAATRVFIGATEVTGISHPAEGVTMIDWFAPDLTNYTGKNLAIKGLFIHHR